jgi:transcriptional regulator with XRE-family HTH domain
MPKEVPCQGRHDESGEKDSTHAPGAGLTAVALAKYARVTPGFINQLEYSQSMPSLQTLQRVANVLDVSLTYFLLEESRQPQVVRQQQRQLLHRGHDDARLWLLSPLPPHHLELALLELPRGAVSWSTVHSQEGQQCHLVLQGTVRADYEDHTYRLEEGDSILWDTTMPYRLENIGDNAVRILIAMAPASLWKHGSEKASHGTATPGHSVCQLNVNELQRCIATEGPKSP